MTEIKITKDWCVNMAKLEDGGEIGAGSPDHPLRAPSNHHMSELDTAERQNAALHDELMIAQSRIGNLEAKVDLYRRTLTRVRPHVEAVATSRDTGHIQADCDLRAIDGLLS